MVELLLPLIRTNIGRSWMEFEACVQMPIYLMFVFITTIAQCVLLSVINQIFFLLLLHKKIQTFWHTKKWNLCRFYKWGPWTPEMFSFPDKPPEKKTYILPSVTLKKHDVVCWIKSIPTEQVMTKLWET